MPCYLVVFDVQTRSDSPWTEYGNSRFVVDNVVYTDSGKALDRFQEWIVDTAHTLNLPSFDQSTLFTGLVTSWAGGPPRILLGNVLRQGGN